MPNPQERKETPERTHCTMQQPATGSGMDTAERHRRSHSVKSHPKQSISPADRQAVSLPYTLATIVQFARPVKRGSIVWWLGHQLRTQETWVHRLLGRPWASHLLLSASYTHCTHGDNKTTLPHKGIVNVDTLKTERCSNNHLKQIGINLHHI